MGNAPGRSIWNGSISFGLVVVPVKLYTATDTHDVAFRQVHREDGGRVQFRRFCSADGQEVAFSDIAKGYEAPDGTITMLTDTDMAELPLATAKTIEVQQFVNPAKIDPMLRGSKSYYMLPGNPAGNGAYALMVEALRRSGLSGIAKVALRQREALALVREMDGTLVLDLLLWPDEVREAPKPDAVPALSEALIGQAQALINALTSDFQPLDYTDHYAEAVTALVAAKTGGVPTVAPATPAAGGPPADLADMLKASVDAAKARRAPKVPKTRTPADDAPVPADEPSSA